MIPVEQQILDALQAVKDPEIPTISVVDLGIITNIQCNQNGEAIVTMTPTFTFQVSNSHPSLPTTTNPSVYL